MTRVSPSILSADFSKLGDEVARVDRAGADWIHLDVMDGMFVPNITFGPPVVKAVRGSSGKFFDAHLMIEDPIRYVDAFADAGCDAITVHCEADGDIMGAIEKIKARGLKAGISVNPETPVERIDPYLPLVDIVLVMTVHPGFGGQSFISDCVPKITYASEWAEEHNPALEISVDGGVNDETAKVCVEAGATVLVAGSFLFKKADMAPTISAWHSLGPDAGCRDGSKSISHRRGAPDRTVRPPREDHRRRRVQHDLPVPLHHKAG